MRKFLVIVESPAKAKTINKYLGSNYIVKSSFGHIRDLPSGGLCTKKRYGFGSLKKKINVLSKQEMLIHRIGIDPYRGWIARYEILPGKEKIIHELSALAESMDHIYLATDLDREGEAIAWHLQEVIRVDSAKISRVIFNEITHSAIIRAFENPTILNINKVHAQQARRFMDRLVGYMLSPLLWKKIARGLSAGRVQSVVVRLIVERERKIKNFTPKQYWDLFAHLMSKSGEKLVFQVIRNQMVRFSPNTYDEVQKAKDILSKNVSYIIINKKDKKVISRTYPPFITATLQQASYLKFGYSIKKTMLLAQRLYESGYITYMRTHSTNVSQDALTIVRSYIFNIYGQEYLSEQVNQYVSRSITEEAHEAIRPSDVYLLSDLIENIDSDLKNLYHLIWCQFVASQMKSSEYIISTLLIKIGGYELRSRNRFCCFDGWRKIISSITSEQKEEHFIFSNIQVGDVLTLQNLISNQCFTKSPTRYNEASLVRSLEKMGIGRPSTYVPIISAIQDRGYVYCKKKSFYATKIGEIVTDRLFENFYDFMDYKFTANMEDILDKIAENSEEWKSVLDNFFVKLIEKLSIAEKDHKDGGMFPNVIVMTNIICSLCGKNMGIRTAVTGVFLSCEGYNNFSIFKNRCKNTMNLIPDTVNNVDVRSSFNCEKCNSIMDNYFIDDYRKLHVCVNNPLCKGYVVEQGSFFVEEGKSLVKKCEKCMCDMHIKFGRFGKYMLCSNMNCKNTRKILSDDSEVYQNSLLIPFPELLCEKSDSYFILRAGRSGIFFAANTFPLSRETRAPLVEELVRFRERLPKKISYLADAPIYDDCGNKTIIRFNRKSKQQYVGSKKNGKITNWRSFFINGKWEVVKD